MPFGDEPRLKAYFITLYELLGNHYLSNSNTKGPVAIEYILGDKPFLLSIPWALKVTDFGTYDIKRSWYYNRCVTEQTYFITICWSKISQTCFASWFWWKSCIIVYFVSFLYGELTNSYYADKMGHNNEKKRNLFKVRFSLWNKWMTLLLVLTTKRGNITSSW